jgi:hypothetical protein
MPKRVASTPMAKKPTRRLRFEGMPTFESMSLFFSLPAKVDSRLALLRTTYSRCNAALRFAANIGGDASSLHVSDSEVPAMRVAYLRAALMEYVGMEEVLPIDLRGLPGHGTPTTIWSTENPMLILVRELRNIQLHLVNSELIPEEKEAYFKAEPERMFKIHVQRVAEADLDKLTISKNARCFDSDDFARGVAWLKSAQLRWGIEEIVIESIWEFARRIVAAHADAG